MQEMQEMQVWSLGQEDHPEGGSATPSSILAWRIPWTEQPDGLQSTALQRVRHDWSDLAHGHINKCVLVAQSCPALCDPVDCSPPGSSVHGILQAKILEWVAMPSSRGSSWPRDQTCISYVSCIGRRVLYHYQHLGSLHTYRELAKLCKCYKMITVNTR